MCVCQPNTRPLPSPRSRRDTRTASAPRCRGVSSETGFKLKALLYPFHNLTLIPGVGFRAKVELAPPHRVAHVVSLALARSIVVIVVAHLVVKVPTVYRLSRDGCEATLELFAASCKFEVCGPEMISCHTIVLVGTFTFQTFV